MDYILTSVLKVQAIFRSERGQTDRHKQITDVNEHPIHNSGEIQQL